MKFVERHISKSGLACQGLKFLAALMLVLILSVVQTNIAFAQIVGTVTVTGSSPFGANDVIATAIESVDVVDAAPSMVMNKSGILNDDDGTAGVSAGDTISYEVTAENTGNVSLTNVSVVDPLPGISLVFDPASDSDSDNEIDPGEIWRWTGSYTLIQNDIDTGGGGDNDIDNTATITSDQIPTPTTASEEVMVVPSPSMLVSKVGTINDLDSNGHDAGDTIDYTITVTNDGNVTLSSINVSDPLIALNFDGTDTGSIGQLSPGEVWNYSGTYTLQQSDLDTNGGGDGDIDNTVTVTSNELPDEVETAEIPINQNQSLNIEKMADISTVSTVNDLITYTVTATNDGNTTINNVVVSDLRLAPNTQSCTSLLPGDTCVLTGTYPVTAIDFGNGAVSNTASVTSNEVPLEEVTISTPLVAVPSISIDKNATPLNVSAATDDITYTIEVRNTGNVILTGIVVSDPLVSVDCGSGNSNISNIAPGVTVNCTAIYDVQQSDIDAGTDIVNTATVIDNGTYSLSETDSATVTITQNPSLVSAKSGALNDDDGTPGVSAGDSITYTVTVENTGNVSLTNVVVDDPLIANPPNTPMAVTSGDNNNNNQIDVDETWTFTGTYLLTQVDIDTNGDGDGQIENNATVFSTEATDTPVDTSVPLNIAPDMELAKTGVHNDDDGTPGLSAGDTLSYTVTVENTGNIRLTNPSVTDPMLTLTYASGDINNDGMIDVGETWSYTGTTIVSQSDLDTLGGGDGDIDNVATVNTDQTPAEDVSHELPIAPVSRIEVAKTTTNITQLYPSLYEVQYNLNVSNTGVVTHTNIQIEDNLVPAIAPAAINSTPVVTVNNFQGTGGVNVGYNGVSDIQLLTGNVILPPGQIAQITITFFVNTAGSGSLTGINGMNTAYITSMQTTTPIPSDDPTRTPIDPNDVNPSLAVAEDSDGDGSPDTTETTDDRDGDGVNNQDDYDPTGYFYCEADGRILTDGGISVRNLATGGVQSGIGTSNDIIILQDGSNGFYQFHVTEPGDYELIYSLPPTGVASTTLTSSGTLDVSTRTDNPVVIGSGEFGTTGVLAGFTPAANPFYTRFSIEAGDPAVFNNNIPLTFCGSPAVLADKEVLNVGATDIEYLVRVTASGNEQVNNVQLTDNLDVTFGAGSYGTPTIALDASTTATGVVLNTSYNGSGNDTLLAAGANLQAGEMIVVHLTVPNINAGGTFVNTAVASGENPRDGSAVTPSTASAEVVFAPPPSDLIVEKSASPSAAPLGGPVVYTITVTNPDEFSAVTADLVDLLPNGMGYVSGSARVGGVAIEPNITGAQDLSGQELIWPNVTINPENSVKITLTTVINAAAADGDYVNFAFARDVNGDLISNRASARVELQIEPVFQCSDLIGRVFDDLNKDGAYDEGEPGLPGVRIATVSGLLITTDKFGRFHMACGAIPDEDIGSNFIMKVDPRTLPTGYRLTSENPRIVRLTRGKLAKLNFAAANLQIVRIELSDNSFKPDSTALKRETLQAIGRVLPRLESEPSILRLHYSMGNDSKDFVRERLKQVEGLLEQAWASRDRNQGLKIETEILGN